MTGCCSVSLRLKGATVAHIFPSPHLHNYFHNSFTTKYS
nr:MAG TPA: hypothetical protein [Caudoviricetes sp.]